MDMQKISVLEQAAKDYAKLIHPDKVAEIDSMSSNNESGQPRTISASTLEGLSRRSMDSNPLSLVISARAILENNGTVSEELYNLNSDDVVKEITKKFVNQFNEYEKNGVLEYLLDLSAMSSIKMSVEPDEITIKVSLVQANTGEIINSLETLDGAVNHGGYSFLRVFLPEVLSKYNESLSDLGVFVDKISPEQVIKDMIGPDGLNYELTQAQKTLVDIFTLFEEKKQSFNEFSNTMELFRIADIKPDAKEIATKYGTSDLSVRTICRILGSQLAEAIPLSNDGAPIVKDNDEFFTLVLNVDSKEYALKWIDADKKLDGLPIKEEIAQRTNLVQKEMENKKGSFFGALLGRENKEPSNDLSM